MRLDTERRRATPEGVTLSLRVAGPPARAFAWLIDVLLMSFLQLALALALALLGSVGEALLFLSLFVVTWFYFVAFELLSDGSTPGKKMIGLQVVNDDGTPIDLVSSIVRNFLRVADFLPAAFGAGLVSMILSRDFQRLGDLAAGTLVIHREVEPPGAHVPEAPPVVPPVALDPAEQRAVVDFAERQGEWNEARAAELAEASGPLAGARGTEAVARLVGMANWLIGRQGNAT
ncbi:MAG: RDD family protein [Acidobacteriota bacterium]